MATPMSGGRMRTVNGALHGRVAPVPMEWPGSPAWKLPSGQGLAEFALQSGFLAPLLLSSGPVARHKRGGERGEFGQ